MDRPWRRLLHALVAAVVVVAFAACGDDGDGESSNGVDAEETTTSAQDADGATDDDDGSDGEGSPDDEAAIEDTIKTWLTEGGCDLMTDEFLEDQTFNDDPEAACTQFENQFQEPFFGRDDIVVSDIRIDGDEATAVVGDDGISNVESDYTLRNESGTWKIHEVDL